MESVAKPLRRLDDERDAGLLPARLEACRSLRDRFLGDADAVVDAAFRALAASARTCDAPLPPCAALNSGGPCAGEPADAGRDRVRSKPTFDRDAARRLPRGYWNAYHPAFGPAAVMDAFDRVFLADGPGETFRRPPPANDEGLPAAAAYLAAG